MSETKIIPLKFYAMQTFYSMAISLFTTYMVLPIFLHYFNQTLWLLFVEKRWEILVYLVLMVTFVRYLIVRDKAETKDFLDDLHVVSSTEPPPLTFMYAFDPSATDREAAYSSPIDSYDQQPFHPSVTGSSPPYQHPFHHSPPYQQPFDASPTFEDSQYSPSYPPSSPCSSTMSSISSPPPPPFKMRSWKFFTNGDYVRMASDVSLSSDSETDIDVKAT